jgi:hypothetical protein
MVVTLAAGPTLLRINPAASELDVRYWARSRALIGARALIHSCPLALGKAGRLAGLVGPLLPFAFAWRRSHFLASAIVRVRGERPGCGRATE